MYVHVASNIGGVMELQWKPADLYVGQIIAHKGSLGKPQHRLKNCYTSKTLKQAWPWHNIRFIKLSVNNGHLTAINKISLEKF